MKTTQLTSQIVDPDFDPCPRDFLLEALNETVCDTARVIHLDLFKKSAAIEMAEAYLRFNISPRVWTWRFRINNSCQEFRLPKVPLREFTSFEYSDDGVWSPVTDYERLDDLLRPTCGDCWPCGECREFRIVWQSGYGTGFDPTPSLGEEPVPFRICQAIGMLVASWDAYRETDIGLGLQPVPNGFYRILDTLKIRDN